MSNDLHRTEPPRNLGLVLGALLILAGLAINRTSLGLLSPDGHIGGTAKLLLIAGFQVALLVIGVLLLRRPSERRLSGPAAVGLFALGLVFIGWTARPAAPQATEFERQRAVLAAINRSEDLIQKLNAEIGHLKASPLNLVLPDARSVALFADEVAVLDLAGPRDAESASEACELVRAYHFPLETELRTRAKGELDLWRPFFDDVSYLDTSSIYIVRGEFLADDLYEMDLGFAARAHLSSGEVAQASAKFVLHWRAHRAPGAEPGVEELTWRIVKWKTKKFETTLAAEPLFAEVLEGAIPDADQHERATRSLYEELLVASAVREDFEWPKYFRKESQGQHPGVSVVDFDRDGWDDFYVMQRIGKNMLFRNRGDGTFEDVAAEVGLDVQGSTTCAIFADFDNDGDSDVFLGRSLRRSMYFVNEDGRFVERSGELCGVPLPYLVSSAAAADYDGDGLLDIYFSTYSALVLALEVIQAQRVNPGAVPNLPFLSRKDMLEYCRLSKASESHLMRNAPGPPNLLLRNTGGRFELSPVNAEVQGWRQTFQSTWADYDSDGDPDLYLANDFSPNFLLRNDGGRFVDVTEPTNSADIGFGMGAAWGDYDNDGAQDLYVTNMFSKAGRRITAQIAELDPRLSVLARGNSLLRNDGGVFEKVSGMEPPAVLVEKAGWSWGGQFLDFNNDTHLDLYALSGYYTAPKQFRLAFDT